jgi:hypothetical protein
MLHIITLARLWRFYSNGMDFPLGYFLLSIGILIGLVHVDFIYKKVKKKTK